MSQKNDIRKRYYEQGKSISEISGETGYDGKTLSYIGWLKTKIKILIKSRYFVTRSGSSPRIFEYLNA